jgi:hypothetical protein
LHSLEDSLSSLRSNNSQSKNLTPNNEVGFTAITPNRCGSGGDQSSNTIEKQELLNNNSVISTSLPVSPSIQKRGQSLIPSFTTRSSTTTDDEILKKEFNQYQIENNLVISQMKKDKQNEDLIIENRLSVLDNNFKKLEISLKDLHIEFQKHEEFCIMNELNKSDDIEINQFKSRLIDFENKLNKNKDIINEKMNENNISIEYKINQNNDFINENMEKIEMKMNENNLIIESKFEERSKNMHEFRDELLLKLQTSSENNLFIFEEKMFSIESKYENIQSLIIPPSIVSNSIPDSISSNEQLNINSIETISQSPPIVSIKKKSGLEESKEIIIFSSIPNSPIKSTPSSPVESKSLESSSSLSPTTTRTISIQSSLPLPNSPESPNKDKFESDKLNSNYIQLDLPIKNVENVIEGATIIENETNLFTNEIYLEETIEDTQKININNEISNINPNMIDDDIEDGDNNDEKLKKYNESCLALLQKKLKHRHRFINSLP